MFIPEFQGRPQARVLADGKIPAHGQELVAPGGVGDLVCQPQAAVRVGIEPIQCLGGEEQLQPPSASRLLGPARIVPAFASGASARRGGSASARTARRPTSSPSGMSTAENRWQNRVARWQSRFAGVDPELEPVGGVGHVRVVMDRADLAGHLHLERQPPDSTRRGLPTTESYPQARSAKEAARLGQFEQPARIPGKGDAIHSRAGTARRNQKA